MTPAAAAMPPITLAPVAADHALVRRVLEQERIAHALPAPDWSEYLVELARAVLEALPDAIAPARDAIAGLGISMETVAAVLGGVVTVTLVSLAAIVVWRMLRRTRPGGRFAEVADAAAVREAPRDPSRWRALFEEHLRAGRIAEALEAAWWWLAASISRGPVDPSWTSGELLARAGRADLRSWASRLDRKTYGPLRPAPDDLRDVVEGLESAV
jgi:hypothetical protein